ncbi:MAG: hypothetical protein ACP5GZ_07335 [Vulcanisaeta sp.]|uniref:Uncharacterized protein n=1 Tax=Vulcanisaeta moutnovskia (strain 768-28) TaxID=985053 RepID=F0QW44_VULM7|nr:hypothetical protein [Vulcanisaeta moutnovskia]ADY00968.1 hypothetical protein VMUT_0757 [Vulcanisaeta moutnovskia 768-28]
MPPIDLLVVLTIPMIAIHIIIAIISMRYLTIARSIGLPIAIYEGIYYVLLLTYLLLNRYDPLLLSIAALFLVIHVGGAYLYINGTLAYLSRKRSNLRYYGYYELTELMFIIIVMYLLIH